MNQRVDRDQAIEKLIEKVQRRLGSSVEKNRSQPALPFITAEGRLLILENPAKISSLFDHTALKPDTSPKKIEQLCEEAARYGFFTVFVNPVYVKLASELLSTSRPRVGSTAGFPLGGNLTRAKAFEAECAVRDGADEIDMVMNVSALKAGDLKTVRDDIVTVREACGPGIVLKVIIETGVLTHDEKIEASLVVKYSGADFVKTSTGFGPPGAIPQDVSIMREVVGSKMGVKASAGIRDLPTALAMVRAGANRIGCSSSVAIMTEALNP
jgi:deoxyribose-phosphate aldolase